MSHGYPRQTSSKNSNRGSGVPPVVDEGGWAQGPPPPHSQSSRGGGGYPPGPPSGVPVAPTMSAARLAEMLDHVRQEFEGVMHDNSSLKVQKEEYEARAAAQLNELAQIKTAVQELESVHYKARLAYDEEIAKLRAEVQALRASHAPHSGHMSAVERNGPPSGHPGDPYDRNRDDRELAPPKRIKHKEERPDPLPRRSPQPAEPPRIASPPYEFPGSLSPSTVPATLRKEGPDWFAMYNPRLPQKTLDVSLLHQFNHESVVCCVRFSKDGKFLATGCNRTAQIFDMATGDMVCQLSDDKAVVEGDLYIRSVCFSPDGKYLATGAEDRQIRIWDIAKRRIRNLFEGHDQEIYSLDFSSSGHLIVSGSGDRTARIWDMETGKSRVLSINEGNSNANDGSGDTTMNEGSATTDAGVTSVAISPDGRLVAAGSLDTVVRLWDVQTGTLLEKLKGHRDSVYSVAFTPDGRGLVSGSLDKTLKYWELNTPALKAFADGKAPKNTVDREPYARAIHNFVGHKDYVLSVAISHDGQWVVSGSKDRGVQFWDKYGTAQLMLQGHKNSVRPVVLSLQEVETGKLVSGPTTA
ncbi:general transcription repressor [Serendipita sp. 399]|nr:general transcription repressor [Serendipita sp. 399]